MRQLYLSSMTLSPKKRAATYISLLALVLASLFYCTPGLAQAAPAVSMDWSQMTIRLLGGLALFLFGMDHMAEALRSVAGESIKRILAKLTSNRFMGLLTGAFVTAIMQSSSVTTVMLVGFVSAGLMSLSQAIGVILGADIGTTITAQIVAFKVSKYALILVAFGFALGFLSKRDKVKQYGALIMGLGLIFFGMHVMSDGMRPLRSYEPFIAWMGAVEHPAVGIFVAALFTGFVQSSSATMGVVIALALEGLVNLEAGIALALGANIGTCVTAGLAALGKPREAVRVAVAHVTFKVVGVLLLVGLIPEFAGLIRTLSGADAAEASADVPRQIANAHTLFNVGLAFFFLPAAPLFARFCEWVVPDRPLAKAQALRPSNLDANLVSTPALALDRARVELCAQGNLVLVMLDQTLDAFFAGDIEAQRAVSAQDEAVDKLHAEIVTYLGTVSQENLGKEHSKLLMSLLSASNDFESIGDIIEMDLLALTETCHREGVVISDATQALLRELHEVVRRALALTIEAHEHADPERAALVLEMKPAIQKMVKNAGGHQLSRLVADEPKRMATYAVEVEFIEKLKRIYYFSKKAARGVKEPPKRSRWSLIP